LWLCQLNEICSSALSGEVVRRGPVCRIAYTATKPVRWLRLRGKSPERIEFRAHVI